MRFSQDQARAVTYKFIRRTVRNRRAYTETHYASEPRLLLCLREVFDCTDEDCRKREISPQALYDRHNQSVARIFQAYQQHHLGEGTTQHRPDAAPKSASRRTTYQSDSASRRPSLKASEVAFGQTGEQGASIDNTGAVEMEHSSFDVDELYAEPDRRYSSRHQAATQQGPASEGPSVTEDNSRSKSLKRKQASNEEGGQESQRKKHRRISKEASGDEKVRADSGSRDDGEEGESGDGGKSYGKLTDAPSMNLPFPHANITAAEILAFLPEWIKSWDVTDRFISNGFDAAVLAFMINSFRDMPKGQIVSNTVLRMIKAPLKKHPEARLNRRDWTVKTHQPPAHWDATNLSVSGYRTPRTTHPRLGNKAGKVNEEPKAVAFKDLMNGVKLVPDNFDALDLTRCVRHHCDHPGEKWWFPNDFPRLLNYLGGPMAVQAGNLDHEVCRRWERSRQLHHREVRGAREEKKVQDRGVSKRKRIETDSEVDSDGTLEGHVSTTANAGRPPRSKRTRHDAGNNQLVLGATGPNDQEPQIPLHPTLYPSAGVHQGHLQPWQGHGEANAEGGHDQWGRRVDPEHFYPDGTQRDHPQDWQGYEGANVGTNHQQSEIPVDPELLRLHDIRRGQLQQWQDQGEVDVPTDHDELGYDSGDVQNHHYDPVLPVDPETFPLEDIQRDPSHRGNQEVELTEDEVDEDFLRLILQSNYNH